MISVGVTSACRPGHRTPHSPALKHGGTANGMSSSATTLEAEHPREGRLRAGAGAG